MAATIIPVAGHPAEESVFDLGVRLAGLLAEAGQDASGGQLPENLRDLNCLPTCGARIRLISKRGRMG